MKKYLFLPLVFFFFHFLSFGQAENEQTTTNKLSKSMISNNANASSKPIFKLNDFSGTKNNTENADYYFNRNPKDEIINLRDRNAKHFVGENGQTDAFISSGAINYLSDGKWKTIKRDFTLNTTNQHKEFEVVNKDNEFITFLSRNHENGILTKFDDVEIFEWKNKSIEFLNADFSKISDITSNDASLETEKSKVTYHNIYPNINANIQQLNEGRKLDYEIKSNAFLNLIPTNAALVAFSESIELPKAWGAKLHREYNKIHDTYYEYILILNEKNQVVLKYHTPEYFSKNKTLENDEPNKIGNYKLEINGQIVTIKTLVDVDWLKNPARNFPLIIDPTVSVTPNNTANWTGHVWSDGEYDNSTIYTGRVSGYWVEGSARFNLSTIPSSATISATTGYINILGGYGAGVANRTFAFVNSSDPISVPNGISSQGLALYNSMTTAYSASTTVTSLGWRSSLFTPAGRTYIKNALSSGFVSMGIYAMGTWTNGQYIEIADRASTNRPYLSITYTIPATPPSCANTPNPANAQTNVTPSGSITWAATAGATSYDIYFGTSPTPAYVTNVTTNSYTPTLSASTTYYWRVVPKNSHGTATGCSTWSFTTGLMPQTGDYRTRYTDGMATGWSTNVTNWEIFNGSTWVVASVLPSSSNNVLIRSGSHYVVLNNPNNQYGARCKTKNLTVEGTLQFWNGLDAYTETYGDLDVYGDLSVSTSGVFETFTNVTGIEAISPINMMNGGNVDIYGKLSLYNETNSSSYSNAWLTFYGNKTSNLTIHPGSDTRFFYLQFAKTNATDTVNININENFYSGSNQNSGNNGFIRTYNKNSWDETPKGYVRILGTYAKNNPIWFMGLTTYSFYFNSSSGVAQDLKVEFDHSGLGVQAQNVVFNVAGELIIKQGQVDIGATSGTVSGIPMSQYYLNILSGGALKINGGTLNTRAGIAGNGTHTYTQTGGTVNVGRNANDSPRGLFDLTGNPQVTISGGLITLSDNRYTYNNLGYKVANGNINITGGKLQIGTSASPIGNNTFSVQGHAPSIDLYTNNSNIYSNAMMWNDVYCYGDIDIPQNCAFSIYDQDLANVPHTLEIKGNLNHEGVLYGEVENSKILFNGSSTQTFNSEGIYNNAFGIAGVSIIEIDNTAGVNLTGYGTAATKSLINKSGTFNIDDTFLQLFGVVNRTNGFLGGNANSTLEIYGSGSTGDLYFDQTQNDLAELYIDKNSKTDNVFIANDVNIHDSVSLGKGLIYTYAAGNTSNPNATIQLQENALLSNESLDSYIIGVVIISENVSSDAEIGNLGVEFLNAPNALGNVTIERTTGINAEQIINGAPSIHSYWDIDVENQPISTMQVRFKWSSDFDSTFNVNNLKVWKKDNMNVWSEQTTSIINTNSRRVFSADVSSFSGWTLSEKSGAPLPVSWLNISATCLESEIQILWSTATEINNNYFEIYASTNGVNFENIGKLKAAGNSRNINKYTFNVGKQSNFKYFKIKQTDFDGQYEFSKIATANCSNFSSNLDFYPNPFDGNMFFIDFISEDNDLSVKIYDLSGKLMDIINANKTGNNFQIKLNIQLAKGTYLVEINNRQGFVAMKKIMTK